MANDTDDRLLLVNPTTLPSVAIFSGAPRMNDLHNKRIGLIDNSKPNAKEFLEEITSLLSKRFGVASINYHRKPSASKPADPDVINKMVNHCDYLIAGIGD